MQPRKDRTINKREHLIKDMMLNLKIDEELAGKILDYFQVFWHEELLYHNIARLGDIGVLNVRRSKEKGEVNITFAAFKKFLENFRKQYRVTHMIELD